jgi:hypothetical protein
LNDQLIKMKSQDHDSRQCARIIGEKSDKDLSDSSLEYACGTVRDAGVDPAELNSSQVSELTERAVKWDQNRYGFIKAGEAQKL